jgi:hypothetical protein
LPVSFRFPRIRERLLLLISTPVLLVLPSVNLHGVVGINVSTSPWLKILRLFYFNVPFLDMLVLIICTKNYIQSIFRECYQNRALCNEFISKLIISRKWMIVLWQKEYA